MVERRIVTTPTVSFSTLAKVMGGLSAKQLTRTLGGHKYPTGGPARSYQLARRQAIDWFVESRPFDPDAELRSHERDAVHAMKRSRLAPIARVRAVRPSTRREPWRLNGVRVSMHPDVNFESYLEFGAAKFSFTKTPLARGVGSAMAALLWYYKSEIEGVRGVSLQHCVVYEPRLPWIHRPGRNPAGQVAEAELACTIIAALWPAL
jgi:hypothetical protein